VSPRCRWFTQMHTYASLGRDGCTSAGEPQAGNTGSVHASESPSTPALAGPCAAFRRLAVGCASGSWSSAFAFRRLLAAGADAGAATPLARVAFAAPSGTMPLGRGGAVAGAASPCSSSRSEQEYICEMSHWKDIQQRPEVQTSRSCNQTTEAERTLAMPRGLCCGVGGEAGGALHEAPSFSSRM
jgi:hypothetical protein